MFSMVTRIHRYHENGSPRVYTSIETTISKIDGSYDNGNHFPMSMKHCFTIFFAEVISFVSVDSALKNCI